MRIDFVNKIFRGDKGIWFIFMFLCMISVMEVFSATSQMSYNSESYWGPISHHCIHMLMGAIVAVLIHLLPYKWWRLIGPFLLIVSFGLLIFLLAGPKSSVQTDNDASRWIKIFGFTLQPSEIAKLAVLIVVDMLLAKMDTSDIRSAWKSFGIIMGVAVLFSGLILFENLSTAALLFLTVVVMTIIAGVPWRILLPVYGAGIVALFLVLSFFILTPHHTMVQIARTTPLHRIDTWQNRITGFVVKMPDDPADYIVTDDNRQITHTLIAVASSGIIGVGPGNSIQRDFLSRADNDVIYAIILEELGLLGGIFVLILYIALLVRAGKIARKCKGMFPAMLVIGCALMLVLQAFIHILICVNMFPITGQTLPLISRGGTSFIISCMYIGIMLSVSRSFDEKKQSVAFEGDTGLEATLKIDAEVCEQEL